MEPPPAPRTQNAEPRTQNIRLHAIVDAAVSAAHGWPPADLARAFLDGGAQLIQIRAKGLPSAAFLTLSDIIVRTAEPFGALVIVNDRADIAAVSGAAGVHVGQEDLPPRAVRRMLAGDAVVGYSTHTIAQLEAAASEPATYLAIGPVFGTATKETGYEAVGLSMVAEAVRLARGRPLVAIGGITLDSAPRAIEVGATAVAVIADLLKGGNPSTRVRSFVDVLEAAGRDT